ncbi:MAG TPA: multiheme c-type cytochrome [Terriglobia bacterium]|nr:multiheme c-type cytochrome [Terriglobia bacterium]
MKDRLALSFLALLGLLVVVTYYAQQPGLVTPSRVPLPANDPSQTGTFNVEENESGDQFFGTSLKGDMLATILDEIPDPGERKAFADLFAKRNPEERRKVAENFLTQYPQSAFLSQAFEIAAKASIDLGDNRAALQYGGEALKLHLENPLLLVPLADIQVREGLLVEGTQNARLALDCLDRFVGPAVFSAQEWTTLARQLRAMSLYILAEAALKEGVKASGSEQASKLKAAEEFANKSWRVDSSDANAAYLLGLIRLARGNPKEASLAFAVAYRQEGPLKARAEQRLRALYAPGPAQPPQGFDEFVRGLEAAAGTPPPEPAAAGKAGEARGPAPAYAGSRSCQSCHAREYAGWQNTGHARMFRPYKFENVFGDFDNVTYADETGKVVARMTHDDTQHYFETLDTKDQWHRYRVDYTIGAKWQQTYATRLSSGEIQVFPLQYNRQEKRWIAFWKMIDTPKSERGTVVNFSRLSPDTAYLAHCGPCHTSQLRLTTLVSPKVKDLGFAEGGINCEMCHGPSGDHVASMRTAKPGYNPPLKLQVEFGKISSRDYIAICAQCHLQSAILGLGPEGEFNYRHFADTFYAHYQSRPYDEFALRAYYKDGRFRVISFAVESFLRSKCVQEGGANCGHCHDFHPSDIKNERDLKFLDHPDQMCLQCHPAYAAHLEAHTHHPASSEGSRCTACHMPKIMTTVMFKTMTHQLDDIPKAEMTERFGQKDSPNACLICHTDKDIAWLKRELSKWPDKKGDKVASTGAQKVGP